MLYIADFFSIYREIEKNIKKYKEYKERDLFINDLYTIFNKLKQHLPDDKDIYDDYDNIIEKLTIEQSKFNIKEYEIIREISCKNLINNVNKIFKELNDNCYNIILEYENLNNLVKTIDIFINDNNYKEYIKNSDIIIEKLIKCKNISSHKLNIYDKYIKSKKINKKIVNNINKNEKCPICYEEYGILIIEKNIKIIEKNDCKHEICERCFYKHINSYYDHDDNYNYRLKYDSNPCCCICRKLY